MNKPYTKYCYLPPYTIMAGYKNATFYAITEAHTVEIEIEPNEVEFKYNNCGSKCNFYILPTDLNALVEKDLKNNSPATVANYCIKNEMCNASPILMQSCAAGHDINEPIKYQLNLPKLVWRWGFKDKAAHAWRLYGVVNVQPNGDIDAAPYLLPNVYPEGHICWRKGSRGKTNKMPQDLLQAYNTFFDAAFNNETSNASVNSITEYFETFDFQEQLKNTDLSSKIVTLEIEKFEEFLIKPDYKAFMVTTDPKIISKFPTKVVKEGDRDNFLFVRIRETLNPHLHLLDVNGYQCLKSGKIKGSSKAQLLNAL